MKIIRASCYSDNYRYKRGLISHTWIIDNEDGSMPTEILRYDTFGFSNQCTGRRWGVFDGYVITNYIDYEHIMSKINQVIADLKQGNRNVNITMGLFK